MPMSEKDLIEGSLEEFKKRFHSSVPLRHFSEHQDEASVRKVAQQIGDEVFWMHFMRKVKSSEIPWDRSGDLANEFCSELKILIDQYVTKNHNCKTESESFLKKKIEGISEDFRTSLEAKFLMNPDMDLKSVEEVIERGRLLALSYFEGTWNHGNVGMYEEHKIKLEQKLVELKKEMLGKQRRHLDNKVEEDSRKTLNEVKEILFEMSRHIKYELESQEKCPKEIMKEGVQGLHDYLMGKGKVLNEKYGDLRSSLLGILKNAFKYLDEAVEDMSIEGATRWLKELDVQLKASYSKYELEASAEVPYQETGGLEPMASDNDANREQENGLNATDVLAINDSIGLEAQPNVGNIDEIVNLERDRTREEVKTPNGDQQSISMETNEIVNCKVDKNTGVKRCLVEDLEVAKDVSQPVPKKLKEMPSDSSQNEAESVNQRELDLNVPDTDGKFPLLRAIEEGQSVARIKKMLDDGADANVRTIDNCNAAYQVVWSLINKKLDIERALAILTLLIAKRFELINERTTSKGFNFTPLHFLKQYADLNEELLSWFHENGADFNAVTNKCGNSVLFEAIDNRQSLRIIQKILSCGGNPKHVCNLRWNVLHMSARQAHGSTLQFFIDKIDVNKRTLHGHTPLHLLFLENDLDYEACLKMLLEKKADFGARNNEGYVPFAYWIKYGEGNFFTTLIKLRDQLPITPEIASTTLAAVVEEMERLQKFFPCSTQDTRIEVVQFILFLIEEKQGTLVLKDEANWKLQNWEKLKSVTFSQELCKELRNSGGLKWKGQLTHIKSTVLGTLDLHTKSRKIGTIPVENFLVCLLHCRNYVGFVEMCQCLKSFCDSDFQ